MKQCGKRTRNFQSCVQFLSSLFSYVESELKVDNGKWIMDRYLSSYVPKIRSQFSITAKDHSLWYLCTYRTHTLFELLSLCNNTSPQNPTQNTCFSFSERRGKQKKVCWTGSCGDVSEHNDSNSNKVCSEWKKSFLEKTKQIRVKMSISYWVGSPEKVSLIDTVHNIS